jgi:glycyl-tRNA synthetase beta chain
MHYATLLVELLTEELPPKALAQLGQAFSDGIFQSLKNQGLCQTTSQATAYATPRRLAVSINDISSQASHQRLREKLLPVSIAFDDRGQATPPLLKKLAALGCQDYPLDQLERAQDGKNESLFLMRDVAGVSLAQGLQIALQNTIAKLPIPKVMTYQLHPGTAQEQDVRFIRPAHRLVALHGNAIIPVTALGLEAGNTTSGHRFLGNETITIDTADQYADVLRQQGKVIASYHERRSFIRDALLTAAGSDQVLMPDALLDEVTALVEWPAIYTCHFDEAFLQVPQECLILTMQTNQKYFALTQANGQLTHRFLIVSNVATDTPQAIIEGNERVIRARLADAQFFFEQDRKVPLAQRLPQLAQVVYHNKLGTQLERSERLVSIATYLAEQTGHSVEQAQHTARLIKLDLLTHMVGEFPELQGTMGCYYARHDGEPEGVALACREHYQPRFGGDALPTSTMGTLLALADKLETLVGIWGIGLIPTGEKDPYALRRHALGIVRLLIEKSLSLDVMTLLEKTYASFPAHLKLAFPVTDLYAFLLDRLRSYLRERGYTAQEIDAVLAQEPRHLDDLLQRLDAVHAFAQLPQAQALSAANKRIANILKKTTTATDTVNVALFEERAEQDLHSAVEKLRPSVEQAFAQRDFSGGLCKLAQLRDAIDDFFDQVMVMSEDQAQRQNRIALLAQLHIMMNRIADLSRLAV